MRKAINSPLLVSINREAFQFGLAFLDPLLLDQLLLVRVVEAVNQLDGSFADSCYSTDIPDRFGLAQKMTSEINSASCNRHWTASIGNAMFPGGDDDISANGLDVGRQIHVVALTDEEVFRSGLRRGDA
jgi:hypothetical protein